MKQWFRQFMMGRYGMDQLSMAMALCALLFMAVSQIFRIRFLYALAVALMVVMLVRSYSRNISKRRQENQRFMEYFQKAQSWARGRQQQIESRKDYRFFKCPGCGQKLRVPKGRGKICITCPKCKTELIRKT